MKNQYLLMDIALYEGDLKCALALWPKSKWGWGLQYELKLAQACEKEMPKKSLEIYLKFVECEIGARARELQPSCAIHEAGTQTPQNAQHFC